MALRGDTMTKTPHEIFDGSDHELIPPDKVWLQVVDGFGDREKDYADVSWSHIREHDTDAEYVRADIAEQAAAIEREEILEMIESIAKADTVLACRKDLVGTPIPATDSKKLFFDRALMLREVCRLIRARGEVKNAIKQREKGGES